MTQFKNLFEKPLIKVFVFGILLCTILILIFGPKSISDSDNIIVIDETDIAKLLVGWEKTWRRAPTKQEFDNLLQTHIRNKILYKEALEQGLDKNNAVIENALITQMNMIAENQGSSDSITESDIESYYKLRQEQFMSEPKINFSQLQFVGKDKNALSVLLKLQQSKLSSKDVDGSMGDGFMLPYNFNLTESSLIDRSFGDGFSEKLLKLPVKQWAGPVESAYGQHLIYIDSVISSMPIPINMVNGEILREMEYDSKIASKEQFYTELLNQYNIVYKGQAKEFVDEN